MRPAEEYESLDTSDLPECLQEYLEDWHTERADTSYYPDAKTANNYLHHGRWVTVSLSNSGAELVTEFHLLVKKWRKETAIFSSITKIVIHPAYQRIIGMGIPALPLILSELQRKPDHWFWALNAITGEDPVELEDDFDSAVKKWLEWGRGKGYL